MAADDNRTGDTSDEEESAGTDRIGDEPIDGDGTYPFAGLTRYDDAGMTLPENVWRDTESMQYWAANQTDHDFREDGEAQGVDRDLSPDVLPERGLSSMIPDLPRATEAEVQWVNPRTGETYKTAKHNAVVNPDRMEQIDGVMAPGTLAEAIALATGRQWDDVKEEIEGMSREDALEQTCTAEQREKVEESVYGDRALFNIPTDDYEIINPSAFLRPLTEVLRDRGWGDEVFGEVRLDRDGGRATMDIYVDGQTVDSPVFDADRPPVVVGLQVQWDFFGDWAVRCCGQGLDWNCTNRISRITDREIVKHAGDVEGRQDWYDWFDGILDTLDAKTDQLSNIIQQAAEETLDLSDLPEDIDAEFKDLDAAPWTALYGYMGLPDYLAEAAGRRLQSDAEHPFEPNFWEIHSAATNAVTHHARGNRAAGGAWDNYAQTANDMLFNPPAMEDRIVANYEADRVEAGQDTLDAEAGGVASIRTAFEDMADRKEQYEEWEEELREMGVEV